MQTGRTQLLCSFTTDAQLAETINQIRRSYTVAFGSIYVLENVDEPGSLCCTYNVLTDVVTTGPIPPATISLHRKKAVNCLYTINALNQLVAEQNGGKPDAAFPVNWSELRNTILVTQYQKLKRIPTKLREVVKLETTSA